MRNDTAETQFLASFVDWPSAIRQATLSPTPDMLIACLNIYQYYKDKNWFKILEQIIKSNKLMMVKAGLDVYRTQNPETTKLSVKQVFRLLTTATETTPIQILEKCIPEFPDPFNESSWDDHEPPYRDMTCYLHCLIANLDNDSFRRILPKIPKGAWKDYYFMIQDHWWKGFITTPALIHHHGEKFSLLFESVSIPEDADPMWFSLQVQLRTPSVYGRGG